MTDRTIFAGLRPEPLASYLAGLGVIRLLGEQAPGEFLTAAWGRDGLVITTRTSFDVARWLAEDYVPTAILSPWNNGSGFGAKDKEPRRVLAEIQDHPSVRFAPFRAALPAARNAAARDGDKRQIVQRFRNTCPESVLPWIDATVVLAGDDTMFPPLLGTGGNDGRLDFSTNFHQRLLDVIGTPESEQLARDLLDGRETRPLAKAAIGQFDPAAAGGPGSSKFGAAGSLVNPWQYVLVTEGSLLFAASTVRRNQFAAGRAAIPFTVIASPDGTASGAAAEETRGEVWVPVWSAEFTYPQVRQLFTEARASWRGHQARRATDFYAATRTLGTARGVDSFTRFGLQQRNGLAFTAVRMDTVQVREKQQVVLAADLEDWAGQISADLGSPLGQAARRFQRAHLDYVRDGEPRQLAALLAALTTMELAVSRSGRARESIRPRRLPRAWRYLDALNRDPSPEFRLACGFASVGLRALFLPIDHNGRWSSAPVIAGFGVRSLPAVLADVMIWRCRTAEEPGFLGVTGFRDGVLVPAADLHDFAAGRVKERELDLYLRACMALDWRNVRFRWPAPDPAAPRRPAVIPVPTLGLLQPLAAGLPAGTRHDPLDRGVPSRQPDAGVAPGAAEAPRLALAPDWAARLAAGRVREVHAEAAQRLRLAGRIAVPAADSALGDGPRIAAALIPPCDRAWSLLTLTTTTIKTSDTEEQS